MAHKQHHEELVKLRDRFPFIRTDAYIWQKVKGLVNDGRRDDAEAYIKNRLAHSSIFQVRNKIAIRHRIERRTYLAFQRDTEKTIKALFKKYAERLQLRIGRSGTDDGKIPLFRSRPLLEVVRKLNRDLFAEFLVVVRQAIKKSIRFGIVITMRSAQEGLELAKSLEKKAEEREMIELWLSSVVAEQVGGLGNMDAELAMEGTTFKRIFDTVQRNRIKLGLFRKRERTGAAGKTFQHGFSLSQMVWDLRDAHLKRLRSVVSSGIAQGKPSMEMALEVRGMTWTGVMDDETMATIALPRGVYRSAFLNALRMTRTETNNAYIEAQLEYTRYKGYLVQFNVSWGSRDIDTCDDMASQDVGYGPGIYPPNEVPYPQHPQDACYMTTVIPGIG